MLFRAAFLYVLSVCTILVVGIAVWQSLELRRRDDALADVANALSNARTQLQALQTKEQSADRRARLAEQASQAASQSQTAESETVGTLRADLAAARQELTAAEIAVAETESKLADQIAEHVELKKQLSTSPPLQTPATVAIAPSGGASTDAAAAELLAPGVPQFKLKAEETTTGTLADSDRKTQPPAAEPRKAKKATVRSSARRSVRRSKQTSEPVFEPFF